MSDEGFRLYRCTRVSELRPWDANMSLEGVSISDADKAAGSPKRGDMVARNPLKPGDMWLVSADYFDCNFEPLD